MLNRLKRTSNIIPILEEIRSEYVQNRFVFIEGKKMKEIVRFLGATNTDLLRLQESGNDLGQDPSLPFRRSRNGRFLIDFKNNLIKRLEFQPFILSRKEDFIRDDSETLRNFRGIQDNIQFNTVFQALIRFQAYLLEGMNIQKRQNLKRGTSTWVSTIFQLRTITTPTLIGEPAKEGVHSDGVEHTMTTLIHSENTSHDSAISRIHQQSQQTGTPWDAIDRKLVLGEFQHQYFLDTLLIVDSELKHSVSSVNTLEKDTNATRDMIILFTRRPKQKTHDTFIYDSLVAHREIPFSIPIAVKPSRKTRN